MSTIILVTVGIKNLNRTSEDEDAMLVANLVFDRQPTANDILDAFAAEPMLCKRSDYQKYLSAVLDGLMTYGVPRLHVHNMTTSEGCRVAVPRVTVRWYMNVVGPDYAHSDVEYGYISVSERSINESTASKPTPAQAERLSRSPKSSLPNDPAEGQPKRKTYG